MPAAAVLAPHAVAAAVAPRVAHSLADAAGLRDGAVGVDGAADVGASAHVHSAAVLVGDGGGGDERDAHVTSLLQLLPHNSAGAVTADGAHDDDRKDTDDGEPHAVSWADLDEHFLTPFFTTAHADTPDRAASADSHL
jgi:hypothetical protein